MQVVFQFPHLILSWGVYIHTPNNLVDFWSLLIHHTTAGFEDIDGKFGVLEVLVPLSVARA